METLTVWRHNKPEANKKKVNKQTNKQNSVWSRVQVDWIFTTRGRRKRSVEPGDIKNKWEWTEKGTISRTGSNDDAAHMRKASVSCRCVRRLKYRSMKMRDLETERTYSPNVNITVYTQPRGVYQTALSKDFVGLCGLRKMVRLNQKSWWRLNQRVGSWDRRSWGPIFMRQKVFLNEVSLTLLEISISLATCAIWCVCMCVLVCVCVL